MPLTLAQYKTLLPAEVGDPDGTVAAELDNLFTKHDDQPTDYLIYLYAKRDALFLLMGGRREEVSYNETGILQESLSDKAKAISGMYDKAVAEIATEEGQRRSTQGAAVGAIATTAPTSPPDGHFDANDPAFSGSPYRRFPRY